MTVEQKTCFVISPIGEEGSETRRRADQVLKHIIAPAAEYCGYKSVRADEIDKPGLITSQVIQHIVSDDLVIADLTEKNPNVFYELAIRHAIRKPMVQVMQKGEKIPFDVAGQRTIAIDHTDLDQAAAAKESIIRQIKEVENDPEELETPISMSLDLQALRSSENPQDRSLADVLSELSDIKVALSKQNMDSLSNISNVSEKLERLVYRMERESDIGVPHFKSNKYLIRSLDRLQAFDNDKSSMLFVMYGSVFSKTQPWLYDLAMEAYRQTTAGTKKGSLAVLEDLQNSIRLVLSGDLGLPRQGSITSEIAERFYIFTTEYYQRLQQNS